MRYSAPLRGFSTTNLQNEEIPISHSSAGGTLTVRVTGRVAIDSLASYALKHQEIWAQHPCVLWDLRELDPRNITSEAVLRLPELFAKIYDLRAGGRTALLVNQDGEFLARIITAQTETNNAPIEHCAFCSKQDALDWLQAI